MNRSAETVSEGLGSAGEEKIGPVASVSGWSHMVCIQGDLSSRLACRCLGCSIHTALFLNSLGLKFHTRAPCCSVPLFLLPFPPPLPITLFPRRSFWKMSPLKWCRLSASLTCFRDLDSLNPPSPPKGRTLEEEGALTNASNAGTFKDCRSFSGKESSTSWKWCLCCRGLPCSKSSTCWKASGKGTTSDLTRHWEKSSLALANLPELCVEDDSVSDSRFKVCVAFSYHSW